MNSVSNITPKHMPIRLIQDEELIKSVKKANALCVIWTDEDDILYWEMVGLQAKDLLWAMEKMKKRLIEKDE